MSTEAFLLSVIIAPFISLFKVNSDGYDKLIIGFILLSELLLMLSSGAVVLGQISTLLKVCVLGMLIAIVIRKKRFLLSSLASAILVLSILVLLLHVILDEVGNNVIISSVDENVLNKYGVILFLISYLVYRVKSIDIRNNVVGSAWFIKVIAATSFIFSVVLFLNYIGIVDGNNAKFIAGYGGIGFNGRSTNETAQIGLLLASIGIVSFLLNKKRLLSVTIILLNAPIIFLSQSRLGIVVFILMILLGVVTVRSKVISLNYLLYPAMVVGIIYIGSAIIASRNFVESTTKNSAINEYANSDYTGSGRFIIWSEMYRVFPVLAEGSSVRYAFGFGPHGIIQLYDLTVLPSIGLIMTNGSFFPIHSDAIWILLTLGLLGAVLLVVLAGDMAKIFLTSTSHFGRLAIVSIVPFILVDMVQYNMMMFVIASLLIHSKK